MLSKKLTLADEFWEVMFGNENSLSSLEVHVTSESQPVIEAFLIFVAEKTGRLRTAGGNFVFMNGRI
jgi:hypothetical protein